MRRIIGIDPGDRWCGVASIQVGLMNDRHVRSWCGVLDVDNRGLYETAHFIRSLLPAEVAVEDYKVRAQGFNTFASGQTPMLMGAFAYVVGDRACGPLHVIPAGDPDRELKELKLDGWLEGWREYWPNARHKNWHHARSAWRVLGRYLLQRDQELLLSFRRARDIESYPPLLKTTSSELSTAEMFWDVP